MNRPDALFEVLRNIPGALSVTLTGSFVDTQNPDTISDIDTIVVFDRLTPARFTEAVKAVGSLSGADVGFDGRSVRVNASLGPLKFDDPGQVVVHLMPYDLASHREHVLNSPFTCFDWERSECRSGPSLRELYPVGRLQPRDFLSARRGLANYIADLESGTLSYRRLEPHGDRIVEVADRAPLDRRHIGEYAYHIIRNLIANALKLKANGNGYWDSGQLVDAWRRQLPALAPWIPEFEQLRLVKASRGSDLPDNTLETTRAFVDAFGHWLESELDSAFHLDLVRHAKTPLNDGTFLGRRDPGITAAPEPAQDRFDRVFSSPLRRAVDTASALAPGARIEIEDRLIEIDYGAAEGLSPAEARRRFPVLAAAWDNGHDVPFPDGEGTVDVLRRVRAFLSSIGPGSGRGLAVTHNVVLRAIVADLLALDAGRSYRIQIPHLQPLHAVRLGDAWTPNFDRETKAAILDSYAGCAHE